MISYAFFCFFFLLNNHAVLLFLLIRPPFRRSISDHVTRYELHEQERKNLWALRYQLISSDPQLLSKLLDCVDWNNRFEVSEAISLLQKWPPLLPQKALELLDYAYADQAVRSFAVRCLRNTM